MGVLLVLAGCTDGTEPPAKLGKPLVLSSPGVHALNPFPLASRRNEVRVWTGHRLVIWGGQSDDGDADKPGRVFGDGVTLDLSDGRWTPMPASPFQNGLYQPSGAWDGTEVVIVGSDCDRRVPPVTDGSAPACPRGPAAAAWNPANGKWRRLTTPPIPFDSVYRAVVLTPDVRSAGGDGTAVFTFGSQTTSIRWTRTTGKWTTVPSPSKDARPLAVCEDTVKPQIIAANLQPVGTRSPGQDPTGALETGPTDLWVLNPETGSWSTPVQSSVRVPEPFTCADGKIVVSRYDNTGSSTVLVDTATGAAVAAFPPTSRTELRVAHATGPWIFQWGMTSPDTRQEIGDVSLITTLQFQQVGGSPVPEQWPTGTYVHTGVISGLMTKNARLSYWHAPPDLMPPHT